MHFSLGRVQKKVAIHEIFTSSLSRNGIAAPQLFLGRTLQSPAETWVKRTKTKAAAAVRQIRFQKYRRACSLQPWIRPRGKRLRLIEQQSGTNLKPPAHPRQRHTGPA